MRQSTRRVLWYGGAVIVISGQSAHADTGIPMLPVACSGMLLVLVPVAFIEGFIFFRRLHKPFGNCLKASFLANGCSTVAGIPLAWAVLFVVEMIAGGEAHGLDTWRHRLFAVTAQAAWLIPYEDDLHWMIPAALMFMLIPCFFISLGVEHWVVARFWKDLPRKSIFRAVLIGNLATYALMIGYLLISARSGLTK